MTGITNRTVGWKALWMPLLGLALYLLPAGIAQAQNFESVERRLGLAVHEGDLTLAQAHAMLEALHRFAHEEHRRQQKELEHHRAHGHHEEHVEHHEHHEHGEEHEHHDDYEHHDDHEHHEKHGNHEEHENHKEIAERIAHALRTETGIREEAIEPALEVIHKIAMDMAERRDKFEPEVYVEYLAGKLDLNRQQIELVLEIAERLADSHADQGPEDHAHRDELENVERRVKAALARGEISRAEAELIVAEQRAQAAVSQGQIAAEKAEAMLRDHRRRASREADERDRRKGRERMKESETEDLQRRFERAVLEVQQAVERGAISEREGQRKIVELRIRHAVELGEITPNQAEQKLKAIVGKGRGESRVAERKEESQAEGMELRKQQFVEYAQRLQAEVNAGELTKEEAQKKLNEVRERMFGGDRR